MPVRIANVRWKCSLCGKSRWLKPGKARVKKFCSSKCHHASLRVEKPVRPIQGSKNTYGPRVCRCGITFEAKSNHQKYCSQQCQRDAIHLARRIHVRVMKQCEVCSKDFMPRPGNIGRF